jgi:hypothetical protein
MLRTFVLATDEVDDIDYAVDDILGQLEAQGELLANSVGLLSCLPAYVHSGVVQAICDALPFDVVGTTTIAGCSSVQDDPMALTIMVLTAGDVDFVTALAGPFYSENQALIEQSYKKACKQRPGKPALIIMYAPLRQEVGGDFFNDAMSEVSDSVPIFGAVTVDDTTDYHDAVVIHNGAAVEADMVYVLCYGNIEPRFYLATISADKIMRHGGEVTGSDGVQVSAIDGRPVSEFLMAQGLKMGADGSFEAVNSFPLIVDPHDGAMPAMRVMFAVTAEGAAICGGKMPVGASLQVGYFDQDEIIRATGNCLENLVVEGSGARGILAYSCVGRYINLCFDPLGEAQILSRQATALGVPFMMAYCGGEHCPVPSDDPGGALVNRYHNCTMVICLI